MAEYIDKEAVIRELRNVYEREFPTADGAFDLFANRIMPRVIKNIPAADVAPVRHGRWIYEAHEEKVNCRWNVTAECSECCDEKNEIWAGFSLGVPSCIAKDVAIENAKGVKLPKFCPNCGALMDGGTDHAE